MMKKRVLSFLCTALLLSALIAIPVYAGSLSEGIYNAKLTTSYANPDTGKPVDGGTNIALGDGMCKSIVEGSMLIEQTHGKTYVTIGLGLMSNVENVRIQVQGADGTYQDVPIEKTGSCRRNNDLCNHYRFEVVSAEKYISPRLYIKPMGRDVQFFILPDVKTVKPGKGDFGKTPVPPPPVPDKTNATDKTEPLPTPDKPDKTTAPLRPNTPGGVQNNGTGNSSPTQTPAPVPGQSTTAPVSGQTVTGDAANVSSAEQAAGSGTSTTSGADSSQSANTRTHLVWWIIGGAAGIVGGGTAVWYFCLRKKQK